MADHTVAVGNVGKQSFTLAANVEDTVTFGGGAADATITDLSRVEVKNRTGTAPVYFRFGAAVDLADLDPCHEVDPGTALNVEVPTSGDTTVHLKSAASAVVSVVNGG